MLFSRPLVLAIIAAVSALPGASAQAGCCGLFGGGWGSNYAPYYGYSSYYAGYSGYSSGYYGSDYAGYGPSYYGNCSSCGCGSSGCSPCSGGGCAPCSSGNCAGGACGVAQPYSPTPTPAAKPEDRFQPGPGSPPAPGAGSGSRGRKTFDEESPKSGTGGGSDPADSGFRPRRERIEEPTETPGVKDNSDFGPPLTEDADKQFGPSGTKKPDLTNENTDNATRQQDVNRPNLGNGSEVIPKREPAPTPGLEDLPNPPGVEKTGSDAPADAEGLKLDGKSTNKGAAPRTRLALRQNVDALQVARVRARPTTTWIAAPQPPVLAKHGFR